MTTEAPAWFDARYVEKILQDTLRDKSIEVSDITSKPATAQGDNYSSDMFRVNVEFSRLQLGHLRQEKRSLILKSVPTSEGQAKMVEDGGFFVTELSMLSATLPKMNEILQDFYYGSLAPRCFHVQYEKPTHVVIEDLAPKGFRMADRHAGMDLDHCVIAIRNIAKFHAASIAVKEKDPTAFSQYNKWMIHKDQPVSVDLSFKSTTEAFADQILKWPELNSRISEKLRNLSKVLFKKMCEATECSEDDFNVLNHGDCWVNNMMFRYDKQQKPTDQIFVDFQLSYYGSPAVDILYFFATSPNVEVRLLQRELLLREYHKTLTNAMSELKCKTEAISFDDLEKILQKRAHCELATVLAILPFVAIDKGDKIDMEELLKEGANTVDNPGRRSDSYRKIMSKLLPRYDSTGLLDV